MQNKSLIFFIGVAIVSVIFIIFLATGLWKNIFNNDDEEHNGPVVITPGEPGAMPAIAIPGEILRDESLSTKIPMHAGETVIAVFNRESEDGLPEEQFIAFLPAGNAPDKKINIAYLNFSQYERLYKRHWDIETPATKPETITMFNQDLVGDRNNCIIITGMNARNEHTITILRRNPNQPSNIPFDVILEIEIDGSIIIQETIRTQAYQQGITTGASFNVAAYGQDNLSNNLLDQIETIYAFNHDTGVYEQRRVTRIPGSQIEQRRLRELLSGAPGVFENFIHDLWYYTSPQGTVDARQYLYFDPVGREIIFFGDEAQQIFSWQSSTPTHLGLYIRSQNVSITTLLRFINIELESLDSIRLRVVEDVRLKISANTSWDGSYRRARAITQPETTPSVISGINAQYDSTLGRIQFFANGEYSITSSNPINPIVRGNYVFFKVDNHELLEMRPRESNNSGENRMIYRVDSIGNGLSLSRIRLGTGGVQDLYEPPVILTQVE